MVRVTVNRGTGTARVGSSRGKKRKAKPSMRSGRGTIKRTSAGSYKKPLEEDQVLDQEEETSDDSIDIFIRINTS